MHLLNLNRWPQLFFILLLSLSLPIQAFSPYSTNELDKLEKEFVALINQSSSIERAPLANEYINHLGRRIAHFAPIPAPTFFIVKSNEINAFAGPGGYIGVNSQLILATENESELAAVLAHEIAHVRLHHLYRMIEHEKGMQIPMIAAILASAALGVLNPTLASGAMMASMTGFAQDSINYTRSNEKQSDRIGIDMLIKAGFNPHGMVTFFKKMQQNSRYYYTANIPAILRSHPLDDERMAEALNRIPKRYEQKSDAPLNYLFFKELIRTDVANDTKQLLENYQNKCRGAALNLPCQYGYARALIRSHHYQQAQTLLAPLLKTHRDNLYLETAMADAELGLNHFNTALNRLNALQKNYPENYAIIMAYGDGLMAAGQSTKAAQLLLKAAREFKKDLPLCESLAQAQASAHQVNYAYFTQSQCNLLQGLKKEALAKLKIALTLSKKDPLLTERIHAKIEEIKDFL